MIDFKQSTSGVWKIFCGERFYIEVSLKRSYTSGAGWPMSTDAIDDIDGWGEL